MNRQKLIEYVAPPMVALTLLGGCAPQRSVKSGFVPVKQKSPVNYTSEGIKGNTPQRVSNRHTRFALEDVVLHEERYKPLPNVMQEEGEMPIVFCHKDDIVLRISDEGSKERIVGIKAKNIYIPTIVLNGQGKKKTMIKLATPEEDQKYGVKVRMPNPSTKDMQAGVLKTTEADYPYKIKTIVINDQEFYVPAVEDSERSVEGDKQNFYIMPKTGTSREIDPKGVITLMNGDGFYRGIRVSREDYEARKKKIQQEKENTGKTAKTE